MKTQITYLLLGGLLSLISATSALAITHAESPDAGITEATAQVLPANIDMVTGTLKAGTTGPFGIDPTDVDVFCFTLNAPVTGATIEVSTPDFDSNLLLLKEGFFGIWGDADGEIVTDLPAGTYYIAVGINNIGAYDATATMALDDVWDNDDDELSPGDAAIPIVFIGSESADPEDTTGQTYSVAFNFVTSDDPATIAAAAARASLENKIKKLKKKIKKAKGTTKSKKLKKKLKKLKTRLAKL